MRSRRLTDETGMPCTFDMYKTLLEQDNARAEEERGKLNLSCKSPDVPPSGSGVNHRRPETWTKEAWSTSPDACQQDGLLFVEQNR